MLLDFVRRLVSCLRDDLIFNRLAFLVRHAQWFVILRIYEFNLNAPELAVLRGVRRMIGKRVLISQCKLDLVENFWILADKAREKGKSASLL